MSYPLLFISINKILVYAFKIAYLGQSYTHIYASSVPSSPIATANTASLPLLISLLDLNCLRHYDL